MKNSSRLTEKEQQHCTNREQGHDYSNPHKNGRNLKNDSRNGHEIVQPSSAHFPDIIDLAHLPDAEPARIFRVQISDPFGSYEGHYTYNGVTYREDGPQYSDCFRVSHVVCGVHVG